MSWDDRVVEHVEGLVRFCPLCGRELIVDKRPLADKPSFMKQIIMDVKTCPDGHGDVTVDFYDDRPQVDFKVNKDVWRDVE